MLSQKTRKKYTNQIINNSVCAFKNVCGNKKRASNDIFTFIWRVINSFDAFFKWPNTQYSWFIMWFLIIIFHLFFDGCILVRIERNLRK